MWGNLTFATYGNEKNKHTSYLNKNTVSLLGAVHKRCPHKIDPPCPQNVRTGSTPLVCADTPKISKNPRVFAPKSADVRI